MMRDGTRFNPPTPIGVVRSLFSEVAGTPIQPVFAADARGRVEVFPEYAEGLRDLEGFERIWLLYLLDRSPGGKLRVVPFRDDTERGVFATRAPCRPNHIGLSCVRVLAVEGGVISIADVDILDGTPLLDIKPYVPAFDAFPGSRSGWYEKKSVNRTLADGRFAVGEGETKGGER
jgi:tRNA-Thr(GGU) m(6)t(6)A37 methyltransferase TsaA